MFHNRIGKDTENFRTSALSHHRTYRPVNGGSLNMANFGIDILHWDKTSPDKNTNFTPIAATST